MRKQIKDMKFRVDSEQDSIAIQKLLFMMGCGWLYSGTTIRYTKENHLYVEDTKITFGKSMRVFNDSFCEETTLEELKSIVGEWLYGDILGCQVNTNRGVTFITDVRVNSYGDVILKMQKDRDVLREYVNNSISFFTNDYNDDTLLFEDFLKFIRSDNTIEGRKYK